MGIEPRPLGADVDEAPRVGRHRQRRQTEPTVTDRAWWEDEKNGQLPLGTDASAETRTYDSEVTTYRGYLSTGDKDRIEYRDPAELKTGVYGKRVPRHLSPRMSIASPRCTRRVRESFDAAFAIAAKGRKFNVGLVLKPDAPVALGVGKNWSTPLPPGSSSPPGRTKASTRHRPT